MNKNTKMIIEAGILIALAYILDSIKVLSMPQGGSITLGSMIPIMIFGLRWGAIPGMLTGLVFGTMQFILGPKWSFHPISILFDYSLAWAALGFMVGLFKDTKQSAILGVILGVLARFSMHVISGVVVFSEYAPEGTNPWIYSIGYNASYLIPEMIIAIIIFTTLYKYLKSYDILKK